MTDPRGVHATHLDAATIAAFVDRTLDPAARAAAEAHLAACADCREVWVETNEMASDAEAGAGGASAPTAAPATRGRSRRWIYGIGGLATAATILLMAWNTNSVRSLQDGERPSVDLILALTHGQRFTEAQTSVELAWQPRPSPVRGDITAGRSDAARLADDIREAARTAPSVESLHRAGLAALIVGRTAEAVQLLDQASRRDGPRPPGFEVDFTAALLESCRTGCSSERRLLALESAEASLQKSPRSPSALFNRALALEGLERVDEARRAWQEALLYQSDPGWRAEVAGRIERLRPLTTH